MNKLHVRKDDQVVVITGKDKGKKGKVLVSIPKDGRVVVENVNVTTKHKKPRGQGQPGGRIHQEAPIAASNVMLVCPKCGKATRTAHMLKEDGSKVRVCKKCEKAIEK